MAKPRKDDHFIKKPIYPGGLKAMRLFISQNLKYPPSALKKGIEGSVYLKYGIDYKGKVTETKILQGLGHGCDEEAERVVRLFTFEVAKNPRKLKVAFHKTIRIHFRNSAKKKAVQKPQAKKAKTNSPMVYTVTTKKTTDPQAPSVPKKSYTYTIKY